MTPDLYEQAKELFLQAVEKSTAERRAFLDEACAGNPQLKNELLKLLAHHEQGDLLVPCTTRESSPHGPSDNGRDRNGQLPTEDDQFKFLRVLGEGGMGIVYLVEQKRPLRRLAAMKIIKPGMDTRQVLARFESERQALAMMNHPNLAKVFDAGLAINSRPYFLMEYVPGVPITEYCDDHRLSLKQRLELFIPLCHAIQHAHQQGIIHRDIKPSNVLVCIEEGRPVSKVIDFGIAKAIGKELTEQTLFTELGQLIGTPEYMSPEQAELAGGNVDARTDIYSLGVLLYELLVGTLPFDPTTLRRAAFDEMRRVIREVEPSKPSTKLSSLSAESAVLAKKRRIDSKAFVRELRGDLDVITMKALEKDRTRRYGTASELADDIARHLRHEPVLARRPTRRYLASRFIRRHRAAVAVSAVLVVSLATATSVSTWSFFRARHEARTAKEVTELFVGLFESANPGSAPSKDILARDVLHSAYEKLIDRNDLEPEVRARLFTLVGRSLYRLGAYYDASEAFRNSYEIRREQLGDSHLDTIEAKRDWAVTLEAFKGPSLETEKLLREVLADHRRILGDDHVELARDFINLAYLVKHQNHFALAEKHYRQALSIFDAQGAVLEAARARRSLALMLILREEFEEAEMEFTSALTVQRNLIGARDPVAIETLCSLAEAKRYLKKYDEAAALLEEARSLCEQVFSQPHVATMYAWMGTGHVYWDQGDLGHAEHCFRRVVEISSAIFGSGSEDTAGQKQKLGTVLFEAGRQEEARALTQEARAVYEEAVLQHQQEQNRTGELRARRGAADCAHALGEYEQAEDLYADLEVAFLELHGENHSFTYEMRLNRVGTLITLGRLDEARTLLADYQTEYQGQFKPASWFNRRVPVLWSRIESAEAAQASQNPLSEPATAVHGD